MPVVGFLDATTAADTVYRVSAFRDGLKEAGFIDGHNVAIEFRWAENKLDRLPATVGVLAPQSYAAVEGLQEGFRELGYLENQNLRLEYRWAEGSADRFAGIVLELVHIHVDAIVAVGTPTALAAQNATTTIPIVMAAVGDPVGSGLVSSLSRPGGNITGFSSISFEMEVKRLQLMTELLPNVARVGVLWNPTNPPVVIGEATVRRAAQSLGLTVESIPVRDADDFEDAFVRPRPTWIGFSTAPSRTSCRCSSLNDSSWSSTSRPRRRSAECPGSAAHTRRRGHLIMKRREFITVLGNAR
jgi:hypothetical protein